MHHFKHLWHHRMVTLKLARYWHWVLALFSVQSINVWQRMPRSTGLNAESKVEMHASGEEHYIRFNHWVEPKPPLRLIMQCSMHLRIAQSNLGVRMSPRQMDDFVHDPTIPSSIWYGTNNTFEKDNWGLKHFGHLCIDVKVVEMTPIHWQSTYCH